EADFSFVPLLIVVALAFLVPVLLSPIKRFGIPVVVGEIVAGIVFGKSGFNLIHTDVVLQVLSVFGFAYLMFLSGLEINFSEATMMRRGLGRRRVVRNPFFVGAAMFVLSAGISLAAGFELVRWGLASDPWIMAMILTTTSLGVVAPVLKERGLTTNNFGRSILMSALLADFVTILLISAYVLYLSHGANARVLLVLVLFAAFLAVYRLGARFQRHAPARRIMQALSTATAQIRVRAAFAVTLIFMALAESLGIANILGAFLAGVIISLLSGSGGGMLREKLDAIGYGFFIPIFFIMVGVKFDLGALMGSRATLELVPVLIVIAYGVKFIAALAMRLGYTWRETFAAGALLSARLSFIVAVAAIGLEIGVISEAVNSAIILVAVVTCTVSPILFSRVLPRKHRACDRVFIVGARPEAEALAERLRLHDLDVVLVKDSKPSGSLEAPSEGSRASLLERLREAGMAEAGTVVAMAEDGIENFTIARLAREVFATRNVIAWVESPADNPRFRESSVRIVNPQYSTLLMLEGLVVNPAALSVGADPGEDQEVRVVKLQNQSLVGYAIRHIGLPPSVRVLRIERGDATLVPEMATVVQANDTLTLSGETGEVDASARLFARR
ncbi:MAG: monovalent cation:proton antiporter family protein, partial [Gammaproteobacteria bacterium]